MNLSNRIYRKFKHIINPNNLKRSYYDYSLDHMYSIKDGFINNIPFDIVANICNLKIISSFDNYSKNLKSSISIDELYKRIEEYEFCENKIDKKIKCEE